MSPVLPGVLLPGAEPFEAAGGPVGVLLCHGFTGSPQTLRPWAEYLAGQGLSVSVPRLPGHGTRWQDLARTGGQDWYTEVDLAFGALTKRCEQTFVFGLSMGGCLALRLAEVHGPKVSGLVLVNPSLAPDTKLFLLAPVLKHVLRSLPGIGSDIKKAGAAEVGYNRVPVRAAATLPRLWRTTVGQLGDITQPVLVYRSTVDHVVGPASMRALLVGLREDQVTVRPLADSYHVATLDNDAQAIFEGSLEFIQDHTEREANIT
jgi:carboxylesterase